MLLEMWYVSQNEKATLNSKISYSIKFDAVEAISILEYSYLLRNVCKTLVMFFGVSLRLVCTCCASRHIQVK